MISTHLLNIYKYLDEVGDLLYLEPEDKMTLKELAEDGKVKAFMEFICDRDILSEDNFEPIETRYEKIPGEQTEFRLYA